MYRRFSHNVFFGGGYALDYHFNIHDYGMADSTKESAFKKYGQTNSSVSSGFTLNFLYDDRRNPNNPKKGHYLNITYRDNLTLLGSDRNWQSLLIDARKYFRLPGRYGNVLALWSYDWFTLKGTPPFFDLPGIGWDANSNTGRGYVQGRFRGRNMMYFEAEYRFNLTPNGLFGGVIFSNIQSFSEEPDNRFMTVAPGFGGGIRIKFNKYSDTNAAIDYGVGIGGSHGFLFNLCEVF
jgi:outer membrane protein assembly factor BamA